MQENLVHRNLNPLLRSLPKWVDEFRPHQIEAVERVCDAFTRVPTVVLDAPTGSGKTLIAEVVRRLLRTTAQYVATTKSLQDQFLKDYPYAHVIKGRRNYPTEMRAQEWPHISAEDCNWDQDSGCSYCSAKSICPYEKAKWVGLKSDVIVMNTAYALSEWNYVGKFSKAHGLTILDEADTLESQLMGFVSIEISPYRMRVTNLKPPEKTTVDDSWKEWLNDAIPKFKSRLAEQRSKDSDIAVDREVRALSNIVDGLSFVRDGLNAEDHSWVYTGQGSEGRGRTKENTGLRVSFAPARVDSFGPSMLWAHGQRFLLMSATVVSSSEMLESLGHSAPYETVQVPSTFPRRNRRIIVEKGVVMGAKHGGEAEQEMSHAVAAIVARHPGERVLVHTVSFRLASAVVGTLRDRMDPSLVASYSSSNGRDQSILQYLRTPGGVLIAPSLDRGIDLPGESCRVCIIAKLPFPNLGDRQISARLHGKDGQLWYKVQTVRSLIQMSGRGVRSAEDWCVTYILDAQFKDRLWDQARGLFPLWWREAIEWDHGTGQADAPSVSPVP